MTPRQAIDADAGPLAELWRACDLTRPWNQPADDIRRCLASPAAELFVVDANQDTGAGALIGSVMVGGDGHRGWLYYLAVDPAHRRQGLGANLVAHAERWLSAQGLPKSMLMIRVENHAVREFYVRLGYHEEPRTVLARWLDGRASTDATAISN